MTTITANEVALGIESFGDDDAPLILLAGATTMLSWPDALCQRLAAGGRRVVRYDLRDSGESTTADPNAPAYTLARPRRRRGGPYRRARRRARPPRGNRRQRDGRPSGRARPSRRILGAHPGRHPRCRARPARRRTPRPRP